MASWNNNADTLDKPNFMNPKNIPSLAVALLIGIGGYGVWASAQTPDFTIPAAQNLQTLLLQEFDESLDVPAPKDQDDMPLKTEGTVTANELHNLAVSLLQNWDQGPTTYASDGTSLIQTTDVYGLLASALRTHNQLGGLPQKIPLRHMIAPGQILNVDHGIQVDTLEILEAVDTLEIHEKIALPSVVVLNSFAITSAEMLHAMAQLYLLLKSGKDLPSVLYIEPAQSL